jgi:hypothetical protein
MPHTLNPSVPITLDKERHLLYGAEAFIEYKEATGRDLLRTFRDFSNPKFRATLDESGDINPDFEMPVKEFRDVLWAGLLHEDESLTLKQTSSLFTPGMIAQLMPVVLRAFMLGLGEQKEDDTERPRKAPARHKRSTGAKSGALHAVISG